MHAAGFGRPAREAMHSRPLSPAADDLLFR
jgi:hypothetical protein